MADRQNPVKAMDREWAVRVSQALEDPGLGPEIVAWWLWKLSIEIPLLTWDFQRDLRREANLTEEVLNLLEQGGSRWVGRVLAARCDGEGIDSSQVLSLLAALERLDLELEEVGEEDITRRDGDWTITDGLKLRRVLEALDRAGAEKLWEAIERAKAPLGKLEMRLGKWLSISCEPTCAEARSESSRMAERRCVLKVVERAGRTVVELRGKPLPLTIEDPEMKVLKALIDAGAEGLSLKGLEDASCGGGARAAFRRLLKNPEFAGVLIKAEKRGGTYRVPFE